MRIYGYLLRQDVLTRNGYTDNGKGICKECEWGLCFELVKKCGKTQDFFFNDHFRHIKNDITNTFKVNILN